MIFYLLLGAYFLLGLDYSVGGEPTYKKKQAVFLYLMPLFLLTALRSNIIGVDTMAYYNAFKGLAKADSLWTALSDSSMEPGYVTMSYFLAHLGVSYYVMQIIISAFIYHSIGRFIYKYSENVGMSVFVFLASNNAFGAMNVVRMWIVVAILLYSVKYIQNRKVVPFMAIVAIAAMFHYSAVIFLIMYPLCAIKISKLHILIGMTTCGLIAYAAVPFFTFVTNLIGRYGNYVNSTRFDMSNNLSVKLSLLVTLCFFFFASLEHMSKYYDFYDQTEVRGENNVIAIPYIAYVAMFLAVCISIIGLSNNMMGRIFHYFGIFMLLLVPKTLKEIKNNPSRTFFLFLIMTLLTIKYVIVMTLRPEWYQVIPYESFISLF